MTRIAADPKPDAALIALGSRWQLVLAEWNEPASAGNGDAEDGELIKREDAIIAEMLAIPAQGPAGLAVKARVMAWAMDCQDTSLAGILNAAARQEYVVERCALGLAADVLRMEHEAVLARDPVLDALDRAGAA